jgi:hypothetical protein
LPGVERGKERALRAAAEFSRELKSFQLASASSKVAAARKSFSEYRGRLAMAKPASASSTRGMSDSLEALEREVLYLLSV